MEVKVVFKDPSYLEPPLSTSAPGRLGDGPLVPEQGRGVVAGTGRRAWASVALSDPAGPSAAGLRPGSGGGGAAVGGEA